MGPAYITLGTHIEGIFLLAANAWDQYTNFVGYYSVGVNACVLLLRVTIIYVICGEGNEENFRFSMDIVRLLK